MKRILNYPGSKWTMAELIISLMPKHKAYAEICFGSGAVFFNKPKAILETINDIDGRIINMFRVMRESPEELSRLVYYTPYARKEYELSFQVSNEPLEDARRMLVRCWMSIGGKTNAKVGWRRNISWNGPYNTYDWKSVSHTIFRAAERLKDAQIESMDAITLIKGLSSDTLIYVDPPYVESTRVSKHYKHEMIDNDHVQLLLELKKHDGPIILSGYQNDIYDELLADWYKLETSAWVGITTKKRNVRMEILYLNYLPQEQQQLF